MRNIIRLGITLMMVCFIAAGSLAATYSLTKERIALQKMEEQFKAYMELLPGITSAKDFKERKDLYPKFKKEYKDLDKVFEGYVEGERVGFIAQKIPKGYKGPIKLAVGITLNGKASGIAVIEHSETPGLGAKIEEASFQKQFRGKSLSDPIEVGEDIDAISGATTSSKAVTNAVKEALELCEKIK
ncbi:MAG: RnfABCDGE type electron transport complex subunit G [Actinomycetota bacterium]|nr:RnfABCDGE type electron transport complex subunit G [Actinomycetota bacterium]MDI6821956.1 RnfABCDGE type electron transport complex subunit G [Actinomycetota bacterium]